MAVCLSQDWRRALCRIWAYNTAMTSHAKNSNSQSHRFATTHWSMVVAAARRSSPESRDALAALCRTYWYPLYVYLRSHGRRQHDAEDLTQEFFATLLDKGYLQAADRRRGRFR